MWAWVLSVGAHGLFLMILSEIRPSNLASIRAGSVTMPDAIARIRPVPEAPITRKPQVRKVMPDRDAFSARSARIDLPNPSFVPIEIPNLLPPPSAGSKETPSNLFRESTQFFGQSTGHRKICYVVDCTGSMFGRFEPVRSQLKESIGSLAADQFFYVIFFQDGDRLLESGQGVFVRASSAEKKKAMDFVDRIRPSGPTNAVGALQRAMQISDSFGQGPELIYFLTDGFDLQESGTQDFAERIENLRKTLAPRAKINTIGFLIEETDVKILQDVAKTGGGQFTRVE